MYCHVLTLLRQQAFEEMDPSSKLTPQYKLLFDVWPGTSFDGGRVGTAQWKRAWTALQEQILKPPVLANQLVVLDKSFVSPGAQASVLSCDEMG